MLFFLRLYWIQYTTKIGLAKKVLIVEFPTKRRLKYYLIEFRTFFDNMAHNYLSLHNSGIYKTVLCLNSVISGTSALLWSGCTPSLRIVQVWKIISQQQIIVQTWIFLCMTRTLVRIIGIFFQVFSFLKICRKSIKT